MIDKTINHLICDYVLTPSISPYLIYDNSASQTDKGVSFHRKRIEVHLHQFYRENKSNDGYILLVDFSEYYRSIPHNLCLKNIEELLQSADKEDRTLILWILKDLINIFNVDNKDNRGVDIRKSAKSKYWYIISN